MLVMHDVFESQEGYDHGALAYNLLDFMGELKFHTDIHTLVRSYMSDHTIRIASTMHPWVVDAMHFNDKEEARERLLFTDNDGHVLQMTVLESEHFYRSYAVGIQHVSEILLTEGFWK